jgi:hypothetical protein
MSGIPAILLAGLVGVIGQLAGGVSADEKPQADNLLLQRLVQHGVDVANDEIIRLPAPTLSDGLNAAEQRGLIETISEKRYDWDALTRHSAVAPFVLKIGAPDAKSAGIGRQVDLWFVVYGDLAALTNDDFLQNQFRTAGSDDEENRPRARLLSDTELARRNIALAKDSGSYYFAGEFTFLDKVRVRGTTQNVKSGTTNSVVVATLLDPAFATDAEFPNDWQSITRDAAGKRRLGELQPYAGFGSYVKATQLVQPPGAVLIEFHAAFAEPRQWFNGANLLRSKLPIAAQEAVRKFRRTLDSKKS